MSPFDQAEVISPKLPLWDTICLSYSAYFRHFSDVLRASWIWLVATALLGGIASWLQWSTMAQTMVNIQRGVRPEEIFHQQKSLLAVTLFGNLPNLVLIFAGVSVAVAWHRCLILGEQPGLSGSNLASKNVWRYVGVGLAICLIVAVPLLVVAVPTLLWLTPSAAGAGAPPKSGAVLLFLVLFVLYLAAFAVFMRLSLLLPARAVGDLELTFKHAWKRTRGNTWRFFWGIVACILPASLLMQIAFFVVVGFPDAAAFASEAFVVRMVIFSTITLAYYLLILPIWIGFLSHAYLHFFGRA